MSLLYIDPGTGSALFSVVIGIVATAYFLARSVWLKLKVLLFRKPAEQAQFNYVIYAEDSRYFGFFKTILDELESRKLETLYLTSSQDDPVFTAGYTFIKGKFIGEGNKAFAYLNFLSAKVVLATTPDLDVLQWKRSKGVKHYCHLIHVAAGSGMYRQFALDYYDSVLLSGDSEIEEIRYLEKLRGLKAKQLPIVGNPYLDNYLVRLKEITSTQPNDKPFTVLVSPSWGSSSLLNLYGEKLLKPLVATGYHIIIRPHPQSSTREKEMLERLQDQFSKTTYPNVEWDFKRENIFSLMKADVMISDFSAIIYDFVLLFDKLVLINLNNFDLRPYDAYNLPQEPLYLQNFRKIGKELKEEEFTTIKETLDQLSQSEELKQERVALKAKLWQHQGLAGKKVVDFLGQIVASQTCASV